MPIGEEIGLMNKELSSLYLLGTLIYKVRYLKSECQVLIYVIYFEMSHAFRYYFFSNDYVNKLLLLLIECKIFDFNISMKLHLLGQVVLNN
jgi:hypothetical protein